MGIVQDYLNNKSRTYQPVWVVKSTREGVSRPIERQVNDIIDISRTTHLGDTQRVEQGKCYVLDKARFPYEVEMWNNSSSGSKDGYGSGIGDLWVWTYTTFLYNYSALKFYNAELIRVNSKYGK